MVCQYGYWILRTRRHVAQNSGALRHVATTFFFQGDLAPCVFLGREKLDGAKFGEERGRKRERERERERERALERLRVREIERDR